MAINSRINGVRYENIIFRMEKLLCLDMVEAFTEAGHDVTLATCAEMTDRYNTEFDIFLRKT